MGQLKLFKEKSRRFHGADVVRGKRKSSRPLAKGEPFHLNFKANKQIQQETAWITCVLYKFGRRFEVKVFDIDVSGDHAHLLIKIKHRRDYYAFVRAVTGVVAKALGAGLWKEIPFTRVANWGDDFKELKAYLKKNREEASGLRAYEPRKDWYKKIRPKP